ncbi:MAG: MucB/RseB C-terminal domain-containing protein [Gammaproteobacteria bacterium]
MNPMHRRIPLLLLAAVLVPAAFAGNPAGTGRGPEAWLDRMNTALRTLNYAGTFVYIHGDHLETMQVRHRADAEGGIERLTSLTGSQREVIRDHKNVKCVLPNSHMVLVERRYAAAHFPGALSPDIHAAKLAAYYVFKGLGEDRVAGYRARVISIEPRDRYRYGYRLWLDVHTGMLLRSDLLTSDGRIVERIMFTSLSYPERIPDSALKATEIRPGYVWNVQGGSEKMTADEAHVHWKAAHLPPGFVLSLSDVQRVAGAPQPVRHLVFSDGLASVSVFVEATNSGHKTLIGPSQMGAVNAFGRQIGAHHVTVVGEVPATTVEMIAQSMQMLPLPRP